ncbi:MAG: oxidoreductase [Ignavibacteriae bacterium]|nr:MAG: oxidoreductase [Ignavibacteriota bacterium]
MLQAIIKKGKVLSEKVPVPKVSGNTILIEVHKSCISSGTELKSLSASKKSLYQKAKEKPEKVIKVVNKIKSDGIKNAIDFVNRELNTGTSTGYSLSGKVLEVGRNISDIKVGDRVAAAGAKNAFHAEIVEVPRNLIVKIPDEINYSDAATVALGAIAMQGVRRADLKLGEMVVVFGTGVLGLLTIQLLKKSGVRVAAIDLDEKRLELAKHYGAELILNGANDFVLQIINWSGGFGADAVLFTAATSDSKPLSDSFKMCKRKGKVVLIGVSGMLINREDIYSKELDFLISTSYGPGRYDSNYEEEGKDYPYAYVRWTENRNMSEYIRLISQKEIDVEKMISHHFEIKKVDEAFLKANSPNSLMIILDYPKHEEKFENKIIISEAVEKNKFNIALVGTGNFAKSMHLPIISSLKDKFKLKAVVNKTGFKAKNIAENYEAAYVTTNYSEVLNDKDINTILICTRHNSHASLVIDALKAGKNVFVEKPLSTNEEELNQIINFYSKATSKKPILFVGYNRRFSKYIQEIKLHTQNRINPLIINYRMNAGFLPEDHWTHIEGGRIIGEACHIIDLIGFLADAKISSISFEEITPSNKMYQSSDNKNILLKYEDGSIANIQYFAIGSKKLSKEYMEVHFDGKSIIMDDYKELKSYNCKIKNISSKISDKGHNEEWLAFYKALRTGNWAISYNSLIETSLATFAVK